MDDFAPILIVGIFWMCIGISLSKAKKAQKQKQTGARQPRVRPARPAKQPDASPSAPRAAEPVRQPAAVSVTVPSGHNDSLYLGSLNAVTGEGVDPCHEEDLGGLNAAAAAPAPHPAGDAPALPFGWTGSDMVRGIVVSEILKRREPVRR